MVIKKEDILIYIIFLFGLMASLFGTFSIFGVNLHFFLVFSVFCLAFYLLISFSKLKINIPIVLIFFIILVSIPNFKGEFGFLQILYTALPFLFFILGISNRFSNDFFIKFKDVLEKNVISLFLLYSLHLFFISTDLDTRWSSIFISLICLLAFNISDKNSIKILSIILIFFILISGSRGAIFSLFLSYILSYIFIKYKLRYSLGVFLLLTLFFSIFYEGILKLIFAIDYLRERTFFDGVYDINKIKNIEFNTSGRDIAWPVFWNHIGERPINSFVFIFGEGPGACSEFGVSNLGAAWFHPHNEIIRIIFDYGILGIFSFSIFWLYIIVRILVSKSLLAKKICLPLVFFTFFIMLTDNPLMYPLFYGNLTLFLIGLCMSSHNIKTYERFLGVK